MLQYKNVWWVGHGAMPSIRNVFEYAKSRRSYRDMQSTRICNVRRSRGQPTLKFQGRWAPDLSDIAYPSRLHIPVGTSTCKCNDRPVNVPSAL